MKSVFQRSEIVKEQEEDDMYFGGLFEKGGDPRFYGESVDPDISLPSEYESDFWESPGFGVRSHLLLLEFAIR